MRTPKTRVLLEWVDLHFCKKELILSLFSWYFTDWMDGMFKSNTKMDCAWLTSNYRVFMTRLEHFWPHIDKNPNVFHYKLFQITISFSKSMVLQTLQNAVNLKPAANFCSNNCTKLLGKQLGTKHISEWHFSALCRIIQYMGLFCTTFYSVIKAYSSFTSYKFFLAQKCQNFFLLLYKEHFLVWKKEKDPYLLLFC